MFLGQCHLPLTIKSCFPYYIHFSSSCPQPWRMLESDSREQRNSVVTLWEAGRFFIFYFFLWFPYSCPPFGWQMKCAACSGKWNLSLHFSHVPWLASVHLIFVRFALLCAIACGVQLSVPSGHCCSGTELTPSIQHGQTSISRSHPPFSGWLLLCQAHGVRTSNDHFWFLRAFYEGKYCLLGPVFCLSFLPFSQRWAVV